MSIDKDRINRLMDVSRRGDPLDDRIKIAIEHYNADEDDNPTTHIEFLEDIFDALIDILGYDVIEKLALDAQERELERQKSGEDECEICGDVDHNTEDHGEPLSSLQPSLHNHEEWADIVENEAKTYNETFHPIPPTKEEESDQDVLDSRIDDAEDAIENAGYIVVHGDDAWLVYRQAE